MNDHTRMVHLRGAAEIEPKPGPGELDFSAFAAEVQQWQRETFPGSSALGAANHLMEEAAELCNELEPPLEGTIGAALDRFMLVQQEAADVFLLLIAVAGLEGFDLLEAARRKMVKNRARVWETTPNARGYRKHVEEGQP